MAKSDQPITTWEMVKVLLKMVGICFAIFAIFLICRDQTRTFYCLPNGQCVTVWKRMGNNCYIIPDKYYGIFTPSLSHIETSNTQYLTLYFNDNYPKSIVVRNQGNITGKREIKIIIYPYGDWKLSGYSEDNRSVFYERNARKFRDVKAHIDYIDLDIKENYGRDKNGKKFQ
ncbi:hypothetical protein [Dyadobacter sp. CY347]|uniref:hypothetical protein n=1 Tax=Dyadobacter sp. CY347 TaxID=2909336 RepID=UPI001F350AED|nr:hypothetical protein [Dyadobacter sp. CY347]MCF2489884.1 hypothetical protein [Dyadobacter sp. CY347]